MATSTYKSTEFLLAILAGVVLLALIIGAIVLRALGDITTAELVSILTGGPPIALALVSGLYALARGIAKRPPTALLLLAFLALSAAGCGTTVPWDKVLKAGGLIVQAGNVMTPLTCTTMELLGAPAADVQRCRKAEAAAKLLAAALPMANAVAGTVINVGTVQAEGVGAVQVRAMVSEAMTTPKQPPGFRLPAPGPPGKVQDQPPVKVE